MEAAGRCPARHPTTRKATRVGSRHDVPTRRPTTIVLDDAGLSGGMEMLFGYTMINSCRASSRAPGFPHLGPGMTSVVDMFAGLAGSPGSR